MNDNKKAVELLAQMIVQAVKESQDANNRGYVNQKVKNVSVSADNIRGLSKIVLDQVNATEFSAAQIHDLTAEVAKIVVAEIKTAKIDTAQIENLSATVANIVVATIDSAQIDWAEITELTAEIAKISLAEISEARIKYAQIDGLVAGQALITEAVGGKVQIQSLSVTDANIVDLNANKINAGTIAVERLVIVGSEKSIVYTINEANGTAQLSQTTIDGGSITRKTITADQIVAKGITAECLNVAEIFANEALIGVINTSHLSAGCITSNELSAGAVTAEKLTANSVTTDKVAAGAISTEKLDANAVTADKIAAQAIIADKIQSGAVTTDKLSASAVTADKIAANTITVNKLASDVGSSLDLSSNKSINLRVDTLQKELEASVSDATGQQMTISFSRGNAIEEERKSITASVHIWKNGEEITDQIPAPAFSWAMEGGSGGVWYGVKEVTLSREDIGKSCQLRCILDEAGSFGAFEIVDGELILTRPDTGVTDSFTLSDGNLYGEEHYTLENGMLSRNAASNKMQVTTSVFDHSILETSHILIKDKAIDIRSGGNINIQAGGTLTMAASALKLTATTTLDDELKGNAQAAANAQNAANAANTAAGNAQQTANSAGTAASNAQQTANAAQNEAAAIKQRVVDLEAENGEFAIKILEVEAKANETPSELVNTAMTLNGNGIEMNTSGAFRLYANDGKNSRIKLGGDNETANFSVDETGKLGAVSGAFSDGLSVGNQPVWTRGNIIISSSQPTNVHDVLWIQPLQGVQQVKHNGIPDWAGQHFSHGGTKSLDLTPESNDVLSPGGSYAYSLAVNLIRGESTNYSADFTVSAVLSTSEGSVELPGVTKQIGGWGLGEFVLTGQSAVNLCSAAQNITVAITVRGPNSGQNTYMYVPKGDGGTIVLTSKNTAASAAGAQTCSIHYIP